MAVNTILIMIALAMLFIEVLLTVWLGAYMARMNGKMVANDAAIFLQGRRVEEVVKQMQDSLRA